MRSRITLLAIIATRAAVDPCSRVHDCEVASSNSLCACGDPDTRLTLLVSIAAFAFTEPRPVWPQEVYRMRYAKVVDLAKPLIKRSL
jgi:hypothetical protein